MVLEDERTKRWQKLLRIEAALNRSYVVIYKLLIVSTFSNFFQHFVWNLHNRQPICESFLEQIRAYTHTYEKISKKQEK